MDKIEQFQKDVDDLNKLLKGKKPFMFEAHNIHQKMVAICEAYYGYAPSTIMPPWAKEETAKQLWAEFGDVPIDEDDNTESEFKHFPAGTRKWDIWHWFEETYDVSIAEDLMKT